MPALVFPIRLLAFKFSFRFASFVETGIQLSDDERAEYDKYIPDDSDGSWVSSDEEEKGIDQDETSDCSIITTPDLDV